LNGGVDRGQVLGSSTDPALVQRRFRSQGVCLLFIAATLAAAEVLVAVWSAFHPAATVHVWRLPAAFDAE
jgi:hypothetical protein